MSYGEILGGDYDMRFTALPIAGSFLIEIESATDERGLFARTYCAREFASHGISETFVQCNLSVTSKRGTIRGMHLQAAPHGEAKLVRCTRGSAFDVVLDLRPESRSFMSWHALVLDAEARNAIFIPTGCAHGFQALNDDCELFYQMANYYVPDAKRGVRWNDPAFSIPWPLSPSELSEDDTAFPDFECAKWVAD